LTLTQVREKPEGFPTSFMTGVNKLPATGLTPPPVYRQAARVPTKVNGNYADTQTVAAFPDDFR
jgi:hypothetical protein